MLFREVFAEGAVVPEVDVRDYCISRLYRVGSQVDGAIQLLVNIDALKSEGQLLRPAARFADIVRSHNVGLAIAEALIRALAEAGEIREIFCAGSLSWGLQRDEIHVHVSRIPFQYLSALRLLCDLGALHELEQPVTRLRAAREIAGTLLNCVTVGVNTGKRPGAMSPDELKLVQEAMSQQGAMAEEFVLEYERRRLLKHPQPKLICRISLEDVTAGYDIISFESERSLLPDRFIEVKSFKQKEHFFLSAGEMAAAEKLRDSYYLYIVDAEKLEVVGYTPRIIGNPHLEIFGPVSDWTIRPAGWEVFPKTKSSAQQAVWSANPVREAD